MKKILLIGHLEHQNFGDVQMAGIYASWVRDAGLEPIFFSPSDEVAAELFSGGGSGATVSEPRALPPLAGAVFIGGGYFGHAYHDVRRAALFWSRQNRFLRSHAALVERRVPYVVSSVEVGPVFWPGMGCHVGRILSGAESVVTRNRVSESWARWLGARNVQCGGDVLYRYISAMDLSQADGCDLLIHATDKIGTKNIFTKSYLNFILKFLADNGKNVDSVSLVADARIPDEGSMAETAGMLESVHGRRVRFFPYDDSGSVLERILSASRIITTKLHLGVVGVAAGKRVICFNDQPKTKRFYEDVDARSARRSFFLTTVSGKLAAANRALGEGPAAVAVGNRWENYDYGESLVSWFRGLKDRP